VRTSEKYPDPFPLHPYEVVEIDIRPMVVLNDNEAVLLRADRPFKDERFGGVERCAGDEYILYGPATYLPRVEENIITIVHNSTVLPN
jgi:major vault protein